MLSAGTAPNGDIAIARWETEGGALEQPRSAEASASVEEHTGELALRLRAPTLAALFAKAGEALSVLMLGAEQASRAEIEHQTVVLEASDRGALLAAWLNELILRAEIGKVVFTRFDVQGASDRRIEAEIQGVAPPWFRNPVKAATYHRLAIEQFDDGAYRATVILDV